MTVTQLVGLSSPNPRVDGSTPSLCFTLCHIVQVSFGRDFEQQLSFCVEARATFCNLEPVLVQLIHVSINLHVCILTSGWCSRSPSLVLFKAVNQLAMETRRVMRGSHSRKTAAFVRVSQQTHYRLIAAGLNVTTMFLCVSPSGVCCLQLYHYPVSQQHLQSSQPLSAVWSGSFGQSVSFPG